MKPGEREGMVQTRRRCSGEDGGLSGPRGEGVREKSGQRDGCGQEASTFQRGSPAACGGSPCCPVRRKMLRDAWEKVEEVSPGSDWGLRSLQ